MDVTGESISKIDAARRQLDTAVDLYFADGDGLSAYTLAYASFKLLMDVYPHWQGDGFSAALDRMLEEEGWRALSGTANFLKHADRDPDYFLTTFHPDSCMSVIVLGALLYRRLTGSFSLRMEAIDCWGEAIYGREMGIPEVDPNSVRAKEHQGHWDAVRLAPREERMEKAPVFYRFYLANRDRIQEQVEAAREAGLPQAEFFDKALGRGAA